jgi:hypothetical protein
MNSMKRFVSRGRFRRNTLKFEGLPFLFFFSNNFVNVEVFERLSCSLTATKPPMVPGPLELGGGRDLGNAPSKRFAPVRFGINSPCSGGSLAALTGAL